MAGAHSSRSRPCPPDAARPGIEERDHDQHNGRAPLLDHQRDDRRPDRGIAACSANWARRWRTADGGSSAGSAFGPSRLGLTAASPAQRPKPRTTPSLPADSSGPRAYQRSPAEAERPRVSSAVAITTPFRSPQPPHGGRPGADRRQHNQLAPPRLPPRHGRATVRGSHRRDRTRSCPAPGIQHPLLPPNARPLAVLDVPPVHRHPRPGASPPMG
jgi:hypothetical protein